MKLQLLLALCCLCQFAFGQSDLNSIEKLIVAVDENFELEVRHPVDSGQTLYSIAKFYKLELAEVLQQNTIPEGKGIERGQELRIPFPKSAIMDSIGEESVDAYVEIYYRVKPKDNLFRISRYYINTSIAKILGFNDLVGLDLKIGQLLKVGYFPKSGIRPIERVLTESTLERKNAFLADSTFKKTIRESKIVHERGIAFWDKSASVSAKMYAMHATAKVGSFVEITNPMFNRTVYAKVVANIPPNTHSENTLLIISAPVAQALGALDSKFYVRVKSFQ